MKTRLQFWLLAATVLVPAFAEAKDVSCTDGFDCLCDRISRSSDPAFTPGVLYCEDFENPVLNNGSNYVAGVDGRADGWADKYGAGKTDCLDMQYPSGTGQRDEGMEGRQPFSCIDIVQETTCEVESDCVFDGKSSLAHRLRPGHTGGIVGEAIFSSTKVRNFGVTMAVKVTTNYASPKDGNNNGPAHKMNEFGNGYQCIMGCSTFNAGNPGWPFATAMKSFGSNPGGTVVRGVDEWSAGDGGYRFGPTKTDYDFDRDLGKGRWGCLKMQWTGWGTSNASAIYWFNDREIIRVNGLDMTTLAENADGISEFFYNDYFNGSDGLGSGYTGSSLAYRVEDNMVVTSGAPASCVAIGLGDGSTPPPVTPPPASSTLGKPGTPIFTP